MSPLGSSKGETMNILRMLTKEEAPQIHNTVSLRIEGDGMVVTDFERVYYADQKSAWDGEKHHPEAIWLHNQGWVIYEIEETPTCPEWFNVEFAKRVIDTRGAADKKGREACFVPKHNRYTGAHWYAYNLRDAIWHAVIDWSPLTEIQVLNKKIVFDNGESGFTGKPLQLWDDGTLSLFSSSKKQRCGQLSKAVETLLKFAIDSRKSEWRKDKKWQELLSFDGTISEFSQIAEKHISYLDGYENHDLSYAIATDARGIEQYLLIYWEWGCMGEDGDAGEFLYLFKRDTKFEDVPRLIGMEVREVADDH